MSEIPVLEHLVLSRFRQFRHCDIDLTHPRTGEPLRQICLTGANGTGKSTLLTQIHRAYRLASSSESESPVASVANPGDSLALFGFRTESGRCHLAVPGESGPDGSARGRWFGPELESSPEWEALAENPVGYAEFVDRFSDFALGEDNSPPSFADADTLSWFSPRQFVVNGQPLEGFNSFLAAKRAERQRQYHEFLQRDENRERTVAEVEHEFQQIFPGVLFALDDLWRGTLERNHLRFRPGHEPAFQCLVTGDEFEFDSLGSGLRRYLLGTAELFSRSFQQPDSSEILFLELPESGLHPELAAEWMSFHQTRLAQHPGRLFVETHLEQISSRLAPEEVFELRCDPERGVVCESKGANAGSAPASDQTDRPGRGPHMARLERIKRTIRETDDQDELADLIDEVISFRRHD